MEALSIDRFTTVDELTTRLAAIKAHLVEMDRDTGVGGFDETAAAEWNELNAESDGIKERLAELGKRKERLAALAEEDNTVPAVEDRSSRKSIQVKRQEWTWDMSEIRSNATSPENLAMRLRDNALHVVDEERFVEVGQQGIKREDAQERIRFLLDTIDSADNSEDRVPSELARRILGTGSPLYRKAFHKHLAGAPMTPEEQRALVQTSTGAYPIVYTLDPTIIPVSSSVVNPWRAIARKETISGTNVWKAVASAAITAAYAAEITEASDNTPTLTQPSITALKAQAFVPFSLEVGQDWGAIDVEMGRLFADAKDDLEALKFALGTGTAEPQGVIVGATNTVGTTTTAAFVVADLYKLLNALPPRFRPRCTYAGNLTILNLIRQFDTAGGSGVWMGPNSFGLQGNSMQNDFGTVAQDGLRIPLLGRPVFEASSMASVLTTTSKILVVGDFSKYVIVDRVGMDIELIPQLFGTAGRPNGSRGLFATWRNGAGVVDAAPFRVLVT